MGLGRHWLDLSLNRCSLYLGQGGQLLTDDLALNSEPGYLLLL
ncbi:hypothetical protein [Deinococcus multiflagellatus]|uniref:Uncharacterized protein n=1 Tax=Deinococcus multiflagellatus TaxID=1656887 RepID=A0ABW1ZKJ8_9DEIO